jgi:hypothetical protein
MRRAVRTHCGCKVVCDCPDTSEWNCWRDPDAVAFYCDLVAYRDREGHWFDAANERLDGHQFDQVPSAGVTLFECIRLAPMARTTT